MNNTVTTLDNTRSMMYAVFLAAVALFLPLQGVQAAYEREVAGWIPYWQDEQGVASANDHLRDIDTLHPFVFEVQEDGVIKDMADIDDNHWEDLFDDARRRNTDVIPTISWFGGNAIHETLSDRDRREEHIAAIVELVDEYGFEGVDIDYENKLADTIDYYSTFLSELKEELEDKTLTCTIEARTPPERKWRDVPEEIEYANDYKEMNEYCDRIELMAYDQQRIDWRLNTKKRGEPYVPVADTEWVAQVVELALEDIDNEKLMLGVPTYGREWKLTVEPDWYKEYEHVTSLNMPDALELAEEHDITPGRNKAGEMSFSYFPEDSVFSVLNQLPTPEGTRAGAEAAAKALLFATHTGMTVPVHVVWYSDAGSIEEKLEVVEKYDLRGAAIFKIDGEEDEDLWDLF